MTMKVNDIGEEAWDVKQGNADDATEASNANSNPDSKKKRSWKKPKDKPMRPLSAYNMFFQNQRERIVAGKTGDPTPEEIEQSVIRMLTSKTRGPKRRQDRVSHGQISFGDLARTIAAKWKAIDPKLKAIYNHYAAQEKIRYKKEVVIWKEKKEREHDVALLEKQNSLLNSSSSLNDSVRSMSSSMTSMSTSMANSFSMSESMSSVPGNFSRSMQLHDEVIQRQQDILRQQMGFIDSKPQARSGGGGDARQVPQSERGNGAEDGGSQGFPYPRPIGGNGNSNIINLMGVDSSRSKTEEELSRSGSLLDSNLQQHNQLQMQVGQKEQLLLQLQQQQLEQLRQLQRARNETSRLSNMKMTDTASTFFNGAQSSKRTMNGQQEYPQARPSNPSNSRQLLQDQFKELEDITMELDRLKEQERQMQQKIKEHQHQSNSNFHDVAFGNSFNETPPITTSANYDSSEFTARLKNDGSTNFSSGNPGSNFERIPVRRSQSGDTNMYGRGHSAFSNSVNGVKRSKSGGNANLFGRGQSALSVSFDGDNRVRRGQRRLPRRHSIFGPGDDIGNAGGSQGEGNMGQQNSNVGSLERENGIEGGRQHQRQIQGGHDSLAALLQMENMNNANGVSSDQRQQERQQQQQQQPHNHPNSLAPLPDEDINSIFMELGG